MYDGPSVACSKDFSLDCPERFLSATMKMFFVEISSAVIREMWEWEFSAHI